MKKLEVEGVGLDEKKRGRKLRNTNKNNQMLQFLNRPLEAGIGRENFPWNSKLKSHKNDIKLKEKDREEKKLTGVC